MVYQKKLVDKICCPFEYGLEVLGGKWKSRVLCLLSNFWPMRFRDLKQEMDNISDGVLSAALSDLMREGIISREAFNEVPPRVEYRITPKGQSVMPVLRSICLWSNAVGAVTGEDLLRPCRQCAHRLEGLTGEGDVTSPESGGSR